MAEKRYPESITGGCLCEGVRYKMTFPPDHDFATKSTTCQCSQCRKNTGSLLFREHNIPTTHLTWLSTTSLRRYYATPGIARGFCDRCGSFLFWQKEDRDYMAMAVGGFDQDVLREFGSLLCDAKRHLYCREEIPGVTDHLRGEKWEKDNEGEEAKRM